MGEGIYYLHIPRTSGTEIQQLITESYEKCEYGDPLALAGTNDYIGNSFDIGDNKDEPLFISNKSLVQRRSIIFGHLASNPIREDKDVRSFCLVREPIERLISVANYALANPDLIHMDSMEIEDFLLSSRSKDYGQSYPGFNWEPNMQSAYVCGKLVKSRILRNDADISSSAVKYNIVGRPESLDELIEFIKTNKMRVEATENRNALKTDLFNKIHHNCSCRMSEETRIINKTRNKKYTRPSKACMERLVEENQLDIQFYDWVKKNPQR